MPSVAVWYEAAAEEVPEGLIPELALPLTAAEEEPEPITPDEELRAPLVMAPEPEIEAADDAAPIPVEDAAVLPVIVVPARVVVAPGTKIVVGLVQGQLVMTVGPGTTIVEPSMITVSPPEQLIDSG